MKKGIKFNHEILINLRKENNLSQEDLATLVDVSRQTISKWETGEKIPDLNHVNKLCQTFKIDMNQLIDGIYETESSPNKKDNDKKDKKKMSVFTKVIIAILLIYLMTVLAKAILFSYILHKNNMKNIHSYGYCYNQETNFENAEEESFSCIGRSRTVYYKDGVEHQITSTGVTDVWAADSESWMFVENQEYYEQRKGKYFEDDVEKEYYDYHTGAVYQDHTPFEIVTSYQYKFGMRQILNPFRYYKINDEGEMIVPVDERGSELYIDVKTGYLMKQKCVIENHSSDEIVYMGHQVNDIEDSQVELTEEKKTKIIENSRGD